MNNRGGSSDQMPSFLKDFILGGLDGRKLLKNPKVQQELLQLGEEQLKLLANRGVEELTGILRRRLAESQRPSIPKPPRSITVSQDQVQLAAAYDLLGVTATVSDEELLAAYRKKVFEADPHATSTNGASKPGTGSSEALRQVIDAMETIRKARSKS